MVLTGENENEARLFENFDSTVSPSHATSVAANSVAASSIALVLSVALLMALCLLSGQKAFDGFVHALEMEFAERGIHEFGNLVVAEVSDAAFVGVV